MTQLDITHPQQDFILLDGSGSMRDKWEESLIAIDAYVTQLTADKVPTNVTFVIFDNHESRNTFTTIRSAVKPEDWEPLAVKETSPYPRGWTPLNDSIRKIVSLANAEMYEKVAIIIMTDGKENASKLRVNDAKRLLDECRAKSWQVIFLGANYDNMEEAATLGNKQDQTVVVDEGSFVRAMSLTGSMRSAYGATGQAMSYTAEDRSALRKETTK